VPCDAKHRQEEEVEEEVVEEEVVEEEVEVEVEEEEEDLQPHLTLMRHNNPLNQPKM